MPILIIILIILVFFGFIYAMVKEKSKSYEEYSGQFSPKQIEISHLIERDPNEESELFDLAGAHIPSRKRYILDYCSAFDKVTLFRDRNNAYNSEAIGVRHDGKLIGYVGDYDINLIEPFLSVQYNAKIFSIEYDGDRIDVSIDVSGVLKKEPVVQPKITAKQGGKEMDILVRYKVPEADVSNIKIYGSAFLFTGNLDRDREEYHSLIQARGGIIKKQISGLVNYIVVGSDYGWAKIQKLEMYNEEKGKNIQILTQDDILKILS